MTTPPLETVSVGTKAPLGRSETSLPSCFDKRGIPIERGDIVKVFHFVGARGKRHYMFKQCLGPNRYPTSPEGWSAVFFSHLNFAEIGEARDGPYHEAPGETLPHYEIVQSIKCDHEDRPRQALAVMSPRIELRNE